ncbi:hypothetical protein [Legionella tunisiensis]|uniref:hypothetical protein n=1 Tax=Legionella tunisiensis TaxID=1034944 RepID=UPI0012EA9E03|nr:hypothetical protein [Legionella tunisiensis]
MGRTLEQMIGTTYFAMQHLRSRMAELRDKELEIAVTQLNAAKGKHAFFLHIKDKPIRYKGIDMSAEKQLTVGIDSVERNEFLASNIMTAAAEFDGGIIVITGFGHCIIQQMIAHKDENAAQYLWYHLYNPEYPNLSRQQLVLAYEKRGYNHYFPLGLNMFRIDDTKLAPHFIEAVSSKCYSYRPEELDTSTTRILKSILGEKLSSHLRIDDAMYVDALIPIAETAENRNQSPKEFLNDLSVLLRGLYYEVQPIDLNKKTKEPHVVIRNINTTEVASSIFYLTNSKSG